MPTVYSCIQYITFDVILHIICYAIYIIIDYKWENRHIPRPRRSIATVNRCSGVIISDSQFSIMDNILDKPWCVYVDSTNVYVCTRDTHSSAREMRENFGRSIHCPLFTRSDEKSVVSSSNLYIRRAGGRNATTWGMPFPCHRGNFMRIRRKSRRGKITVRSDTKLRKLWDPTQEVPSLSPSPRLFLSRSLFITRSSAWK